MGDAMIADLREKFAKFGQAHVLNFVNELPQNEREKFLSELTAMDLQEIKDTFVRASLGSPVQKFDDVMEPIPLESVGHATTTHLNDAMHRWNDIGLQAIGESKVAALLLAGGQGTRLGWDFPKGMFPLKLDQHGTLFQVQGERIKKLQQLAAARLPAEKKGHDVVIPWYIMTSGATRLQTRDFFEQNKYFGLEANNVRFFEQGQIPCLTNTGQLILDTKSSISRSPDGNGGLYASLRDNGILDDMEKRGIEFIHVYCVDNILVKVADPVFIGFCIEKQSEVGALVVAKSSPTEAVGVICLCEGKYQVVEYSEINEDTARRTNSDGSLTFNAGNICNHFFTMGFLKHACAKAAKLKHHIAHKKIPYVDISSGEVVKPAQNNGIKMEKFVFDVFQFAQNLSVLEVARHVNFSPLKNGLGASSGTVEHCRSDLYALHREYLRNAGCKFFDENDDEIPYESLNASHVCEISPLVSYAGEGLEEFAKANPKVHFPIILKP